MQTRPELNQFDKDYETFMLLSEEADLIAIRKAFSIERLNEINEVLKSKISDENNADATLKLKCLKAQSIAYRAISNDKDVINLAKKADETANQALAAHTPAQQITVSKRFAKLGSEAMKNPKLRTLGGALLTLAGILLMIAMPGIGFAIAGGYAFVGGLSLFGSGVLSDKNKKAAASAQTAQLKASAEEPIGISPVAAR